MPMRVIERPEREDDDFLLNEARNLPGSIRCMCINASVYIIGYMIT